MVFTNVQSVSHSGTAIIALSDVDLDVSSKNLTLADLGIDALWAYIELLAIRIELTTTATSGIRRIEVRIENTTGPDILYELAIANGTLVNNSSRTWQLAPGVDESVTDPTQQVQLPPGLYVSPGLQLVIEDATAIDPAADDMIVHVLGRLYGIRSL